MTGKAADETLGTLAFGLASSHRCRPVSFIQTLLVLFLTLPVRELIAASPTSPPPIPRQFRAMWIATVGNIDWPSKSGLPVATQQTELLFLLDTARRLHLNAVIFQVRTSCDALYDSPYEPWSEYLSGRMGVAPKPFWDPLAFAITEAHHRGLELHAWFNPFRARYHPSLSPISPSHISRRRPDLLVEYGHFLWMDPGFPASRTHSLKVINDVVRRYDVDGIHIDDYFYPYPEKGASAVLPFPDDPSWNLYLAAGGRLSRNDWRRDNINTLIRDLGSAIHRQKSWVKFGISPFGIWRPGYPVGIRGLDQHELLYADARKWIREGYADYMSPQLYWTESQEAQKFSRLLDWWASENQAGHHLWPGLNSADVGKGRDAAEILKQVQRISANPTLNGVVFWNASSLRDNRDGLASSLQKTTFASPALIPASPWLGKSNPPAPILSSKSARASPILLTLRAAQKEPPSALIAQSRYDSGWRTEILPGPSRRVSIARSADGKPPSEVRLSWVNRTGVEGPPVIWKP